MTQSVTKFSLCFFVPKKTSVRFVANSFSWPSWPKTLLGLSAAAAAAATAATWSRTGSGWIWRGQRGLRAEHLGERGVGAHLVHVAAADTDGANQLLLNHDWEAAADEVVREALFFAEVDQILDLFRVFLRPRLSGAPRVRLGPC